ncbi:MAG: acyl-CoA dehydrogenase domain-containing protein, partial [Bdellovibrionia bacterium]
LGITCALIPVNSPGITLGDRHDPLGVPFHNCPTQGKDVIVSADAIVGGIANAGRGWRMLMECLSAGRGVSLPAQSAGGAQLVTRVVSAHALVRQQFGVSIGRFEGIQEPLSQIVGFNYILESLRCYTLSALNQGKKPGIATAISKYYSTELARIVINHAMDIMGGAGISLGPKNLVGHLYISTPIGITVEGANILTRSLMIFGQGALRAHPFAFKEVKAMAAGDLRSFDQAFWGHIGHIVRNSFRSILLSMTRGWMTIPARSGSTAVYYRRLNWASASFAILADIAMGSLGGKLKFKESLGGRFADILAYMYIGTAVLRRYEAEGARKEDLPLVHFSMCFILGKIQRAFDGIFANLQVPGLTWLFRGPLKSWSELNCLGGDVSDYHVKKIANMILNDESQRDHLTRGIFIPKDSSQQLFLLDRAVAALRKAEVIEKKLRKAVISKQIQKSSLQAMTEEALKKNLITPSEANDLTAWDELRREAIKVDSFTEEEYVSRTSARSSSRSPQK